MRRALVAAALAAELGVPSEAEAMRAVTLDATLTALQVLSNPARRGDRRPARVALSDGRAGG